MGGRSCQVLCGAKHGRPNPASFHVSPYANCTPTGEETIAIPRTLRTPGRCGLWLDPTPPHAVRARDLLDSTGAVCPAPTRGPTGGPSSPRRNLVMQRRNLARIALALAGVFVVAGCSTTTTGPIPGANTEQVQITGY